MTFEANTGLNVSNYYGPRGVEDHNMEGRIRTAGSTNELILFVDADNYSTLTGTIPAGAIVMEAFADVTTAFAFTGGTSPSMDVGTDTSEVTNGANLVLTSTGTEAGGALAGTWASPLAAETTVGIATAGSPTSVDAGRAKVVIRYQVV